MLNIVIITSIVSLLILLMVGFCIISTKVSNMSYKDEQSIPKYSPISTCNINDVIAGRMDKKTVEKFLVENPMYTEQSIKERMYGLSIMIVQRMPSHELTEKVLRKIQKDSKLDIIKRMALKHIDLAYYHQSHLVTYLTYTDNRDEYCFSIDCNLQGQSITVNKYSIYKGAVVGF